MHLQHDDDAIQEGLKFLCLASMRFDDKQNTKFSTYACKYIRGGIQMYLKNNNRVNHITLNRQTIPVEFVDIDDEQIHNQVYTNSINEVEVNDFVVELMKRVDDMTKIILQMFFEGYNQKEIGAKLGKSQSYVSMKLRNVRQVRR